jgi:SAM-dependent methyltransferase
MIAGTDIVSASGGATAGRAAGVDGVVRVYERSHAAGLVGDVIRPGGLALTDHLIRLAGIDRGELVVEIGCGPGASADHLIRNRHLSVIGLDRSEALLGAARARAAGPLVRGDGCCLPFADGTADAVLAECALSLLPDIDAAVVEIRRVLRPGGRLLWSDVYARRPEGAMALRALPLESCVRGAMSRRDLLGLVGRHGFEVRHWEDHSDELRTFAARLVWQGGSMGAFWCRAGGVSDPEVIDATVTAARPGYYLMIAERGPGSDLVPGERVGRKGGRG